MKRSHFPILAALAMVTAPALATTVAVRIGDPGYYGPVTVVGYPQPQLVYAEPIVVQRVAVVREPVYIRVPVVQAQNWRSYCGRYNACNRPTYFVEDSWYRDVYAPQYRERRTLQTTNQDVYAPQYRDRPGQQTTYQQQKLAAKQAELTRKSEREQQKLDEKSQKEQQKLAEKSQKEQDKRAEKSQKEQEKMAKKLDKEQRKLDKKQNQG